MTHEKRPVFAKLVWCTRGGGIVPDTNAKYNHQHICLRRWPPTWGQKVLGRRLRTKAARTKPRWRSYAKLHLAPRRTGPLACNEHVGVQFILDSARAKQMGEGSNATPKNRCVGLSAPLAYAHTRGIRAKTPPLASVLEAPLPWCAVRSHNSDPTSGGPRPPRQCTRVVVGCSRSRGSSCEHERASGTHPHHSAKTAPRSKAHAPRTKIGARALG